MKTSIIKWIKKNWPFLIFVLAIILFVISASIGVNKIKEQARKIAVIETENAQLQKERQEIAARLDDLQKEYEKLEKRSDSLQAKLDSKQKELNDLVWKHKKEIDSLLSVPDDTIYIRLQPIYPNIDSSPLTYPFSGSQIRQIYGTALELPRLNERYQLQGSALNTCLQLSEGHKAEINNLYVQIEFLKKDISKCDAIGSNYKSQIGILEKDNSRQKFWKKVFLTVAGITTGIAVLK